VAEGTRLLSEYGVNTPSRVRIPPSPLAGWQGERPAPVCQKGIDAGRPEASTSVWHGGIDVDRLTVHVNSLP
jgi:hypothetical protein